ncbi:MAG: FAD-dependent oxidoreductase [Actinomycetota bacterium]
MAGWSLRRNRTERPEFFRGVPDGAAEVAEVDRRVIVIGAGPAGLTAARLLAENGCDVVVIEGRSRLGGRLHTMALGGGIVDEGANWIHGAPANPLYHVAVEAGLDIQKDPIANPLRLTAFDEVSGRRISQPRMLYVLVRVARVMGRLGKESPSAVRPERSLAQRLDREASRIRGTVNRRYFRSLLGAFVEMNWAKDAERLDPNTLAINPEDGGGDYVIHGGYRTVIDMLAAGMDVRLDSSVEAIRYGDHGVMVETAEETFEGSHVIVTVPLGVLKAEAIGFDPPLPDWKAAAIDSLGVGIVEKIAMTFSRPFWRSNPKKPQSLFHVSETLGEFPAFVDTTASAGCPTLVAFLTGTQAEQLGVEPAPLIERAGDVLQRMFPDAYEPPSAVHATAWGADPFALCSYSTVAIGTSIGDYDQLAAPVEGRVLFAGEATYQPRGGYVEGAMASGVREARRILGTNAELTMCPRQTSGTQPAASPSSPPIRRS